MNSIAEWLKQSKGAPLVAALLVLMLMTNAIFDFILKAPEVFREKQSQNSALSSEAQTTLNSLVSTLRSTNEALQEINVTNGKIITAIQANALALGDLKQMMENTRGRQLTKDEFQSQIDVLKKKIEKLEK